MAKEQDERTTGEIRDSVCDQIARVGEQHGLDFEALHVMLDGRHRTLDAAAIKAFIETKGLKLMYRPGFGAAYLYRDEGYHELLERPRLREILIGLLVEIQMQYRLLDQLFVDGDLKPRDSAEVRGRASILALIA